MEPFEQDLRRRLAEEERGTWREALRNDFAPWFDDLAWGFSVGDGWQEILRDLTAEIARIVGSPDCYSKLRVTQVKEKYGTLRFYILGLTMAHSDAVDAAILAAEMRSAQVCEDCGAPGELREGSDGWWYTACARHAVD